MIQLNEDQGALSKLILTWFTDIENGNYRPWYPHPQWISYSGAAGTGKTTVLKYILKALGVSEYEYIACAYVGKAVLQLQKHGLLAQTIHSTIYDYKVAFLEDIVTRKKRAKLIVTLKPSLPRYVRLIVVDEATMVNDEMAAQLLSFGIPTIFFGDENQLPPIFGKSSVMLEPNYTLNTIMRQVEDDPIVVYSQMILRGEELPYGVFGKSKVISSNELIEDDYISHDQILVSTNNERYGINYYIRREILEIEDNMPVIGDRVICRRSNWSKTCYGYALTNGLSGRITDINRDRMYRGYMSIDFQPDFLPAGQEFTNLDIDLNHIIKNTHSDPPGFTDAEIFEYAYGITVHLSQGSEYQNVLYFMNRSAFKDSKNAKYTAITRARNSITIVKD